MGYELYIFPPEGAPQTMTTQTVVAAFAAAGLQCTEQPDEFGHWLVIEGIESSLDVTIQDDIVTGANFRFVTEDVESVVQSVATVFKSIGWQVADDEGIL